MDILTLLLFMALLLATPKLWARYIFFKHNRGRKDLPETGGELANKQLRRLKLSEINLVSTPQRSHYNPATKSVCLTNNTMNNHSLTALVKAAYEVGHAQLDKRRHPLMRFRQRLLELANFGDRLGSIALLLTPLIALLDPNAGGLLLFYAVVTMLTGALVHLIVIPIEWRAGFEFALPILNNDSPLSQQDQLAIKQLLVACIFSHFAYALANLLDGRHWLQALPFKRNKA